MTDPLSVYQQRILGMIKKHGFAVQTVFAGEDHSIEPFYAYTMGLSAKGLPELLVVGLPLAIAQNFLQTIAERMRAGVLRAEDGFIITDVASMPLYLKAVDLSTAGEFALGARQLASEHGYPLSFIQVVFPDAKGIFPWQAGCDPAMTKLQHLEALLPSGSIPIDPSKLH